MRLARPEWERLAEYVSNFEEEVQRTIAARLATPRVCALLDPSTGACMVYPVRPIACRSYGFYVGRDGGRWCAIIEEQPELTDSVVLGNHTALEHSLAALGETATLADWWRELAV